LLGVMQTWCDTQLVWCPLGDVKDWCDARLLWWKVGEIQAWFPVCDVGDTEHYFSYLTRPALNRFPHYPARQEILKKLE
jgi:hypothetical protein